MVADSSIIIMTPVDRLNPQSQVQNISLKSSSISPLWLYTKLELHSHSNYDVELRCTQTDGHTDR